MDKKNAIIDLWRSSFDDSEDFLKLFFDRIYKDENALTLEKNGKIVSTLQVLPYTMTYYHKEISVGYIYGACTAPGEEGKGYMTELMDQAFQFMKKKDVALAVTIPATPELFGFYKKRGFSDAFDYVEKHYTRPATPIDEPRITVMPPEEPSLDALYHFFDCEMRSRTCCMLHTYPDFINILRDAGLSGTQVLAAIDDDDTPLGLAFLSGKEYWKPGEIYIRELVYTDDHVRNLLLQEATRQNNVQRATYRSAFEGEDTKPLGLARVIDRKRMIRHWGSTHEFSVLNEGELEKMDDYHLTKILLDYENREAYMSLMFEQ